jgi:hypothetical protein
MILVVIVNFVLDLAGYFANEDLADYYLAKSAVKLCFAGLIGLSMLKFKNSKNTIIIISTCFIYTVMAFDSYHTAVECNIVEAPVNDQI